MTVQCEPMPAGPDGWSEWIHPLPGYLMQCCDCGLIHDMEFAIMPFDGEPTDFNFGEGVEGGLIVFRARRLARDSDSDPQGENSRSEVEGEASQSGAAKTAHRPVSPCNSPQPEDPQS